MPLSVWVCVRERGSGGRDTGQRQRETRRHGACACVCVSVIGEEKTAVSLSSLVSLQRPVLGCKRACQAVSVTTCHTERTHTRTHTHAGVQIHMHTQQLTFPEEIMSRLGPGCSDKLIQPPLTPYPPQTPPSQPFTLLLWLRCYTVTLRINRVICHFQSELEHLTSEGRRR